MNKRKLLCKLGACTLAAALCVPFLAPTRANAASSRVEEILGNMTLKQKVEQMLMPDFRDWSTTGEGTAPDFTEMNDQVAQVLHDRSVELAREYGIVVEVLSAFTGEPGTLVGDLE